MSRLPWTASMECPSSARCPQASSQQSDARIAPSRQDADGAAPKMPPAQRSRGLEWQWRQTCLRFSVLALAPSLVTSVPAGAPSLPAAKPAASDAGAASGRQAPGKPLSFLEVLANTQADDVLTATNSNATPKLPMVSQNGTAALLIGPPPAGLDSVLLNSAPLDGVLNDGPASLPAPAGKTATQSTVLPDAAAGQPDAEGPISFRTLPVSQLPALPVQAAAGGRTSSQKRPKSTSDLVSHAPVSDAASSVPDGSALLLSVATAAGSPSQSDTQQASNHTPLPRADLPANGSSTPLQTAGLQKINSIAFAVRVPGSDTKPADGTRLAASSNKSGKEAAGPAGAPESTLSDPLPDFSHTAGAGPVALPAGAASQPLALAPTLSMESSAAPATTPKAQPAVDLRAASAASAAADSSSDAPASSTSVRSMQVQITGRDSQRVDLSLVERAGSLSMSVRTPDGNLTRALQDHLPELASKFSDQQIRAEWWTPKTQVASAEGSQNNAKQDYSRSQGQADQNGQDAGRQGRQNNQAKWVEELAETANKTNIKKGYIWHQ